MTLRLGCSTGTLFPQFTTEEAIDTLARLGVEDVEVMLQSHGECEPAFHRQLSSLARDAGVRIHSVHALVQTHPVFDAYRRRAEEGWLRFEQVAAGTSAMGAEVLVWHGLCRDERGFTLTSPEVFAAIDRLAGICAQHGLLLGLENVSWCAMSQVRDVLTLLSRLPELAHGRSVAFTFDAFQAAEANANPFMLLQAMENRVVNVHLRDRDPAAPERRNLMPGEGSLPWPALLRAIAGVGYAGPLILEGALRPDPAASLCSVRAVLDPLLAESMPSDDICAGSLPAGVRHGIDLFNSGAFYECHEAIEHEWHAERGQIRQLYQGILQIGVGFHHARNGNRRGAILLLTDGIDKITSFLPTCRGVDIASLVTESSRWLQRIQETDSGDQVARMDWSDLPTIRETIHPHC